MFLGGGVYLAYSVGVGKVGLYFGSVTTIAQLHNL